MKSSKKWRNQAVKDLFKAILKLKTPVEAAAFFRDLCTLEELAEMASRWQAAKMLAQGRPYREIAKKTGLSTATVVRVAHWLNYGEGGYKLMLKRVKGN